MKTFTSTLVALSAAALLTTAAFDTRAADFTFSGDITFHNDIVQIDFTLDTAASGVRIWTDSWLSGLNFDPTAALWRGTGSDFALLATVDDDDTVGPGQGYYDAGFHLDTLAAGHYRVTLAAAVNAPVGAWLSQGFAYDGETPIPVALWNQPTYDPNANDQKGSFWRIHLSSVDTASAVPEAGSAWLLLAGIGALCAARGRRNASA